MEPKSIVRIHCLLQLLNTRRHDFGSKDLGCDRCEVNIVGLRVCPAEVHSKPLNLAGFVDDVIGEVHDFPTLCEVLRTRIVERHNVHEEPVVTVAARDPRMLLHRAAEGANLDDRELGLIERCSADDGIAHKVDRIISWTPFGAHAVVESCEWVAFLLRDDWP